MHRQCFVWEMAQKTEMAITSFKSNHFYPNFNHKSVWKSSQITEIDGNPPMTDPTQNTDRVLSQPLQMLLSLKCHPHIKLHVAIEITMLLK